MSRLKWQFSENGGGLVCYLTLACDIIAEEPTVPPVLDGHANHQSRSHQLATQQHDKHTTKTNKTASGCKSFGKQNSAVNSTGRDGSNKVR